MGLPSSPELREKLTFNLINLHMKDKIFKPEEQDRCAKKVFDGALLTLKYFFDFLTAKLWKSLLYRELDFEGDVLKHPEYLQEAYETGKRICFGP